MIDKDNNSSNIIINTLNQIEENKLVLNDISLSIYYNVNIDKIEKIKEFQIHYNSNELYIIKIGIYLNDYIIFICYKETDEENEIYYIGLYNINDFSNINNIFLLYNEITDLYKCLLNIFLKENNVKISKNICDSNYMNININIYLPDGEKSYISLKLFKKEKNEDIYFYQRYIGLNLNKRNYLMKEYKIIKLDAIPHINKENNDFPKRKIWNKNLRNDELFVLFNKIYNTSLKINNKDIIISEKDIKSEGLSRLCQLHFIYIESLQLNKNSISIIDYLINFSSINRLKILKLHDNNIIKIDILNKCNFIPHLIELFLQNNQIKNLNGFANCDFKKLKLLYLYNNKIVNIEGLRNCHFYKLEQLLLYNNQIENIDILSNCNFNQLKILNLYNNKIKDISPLTKCDFSKLEKFIINKNKILYLKFLYN